MPTTQDLERARETLGITDGLRVWVGGHNVAGRRVVEKLVVGTVRAPTGALDAAFVCPEMPGEAEYFAAKLRARLSPGALLILVREAGKIESPQAVNSPDLTSAGYTPERTIAIGESLVATVFRVSGAA